MDAGLDEAGRGPVVGPLVVALVAIDDARPLQTLGVKDSKRLSPAQRLDLYDRILSTAHRVESVNASAQQLDDRMRRQSLNDVELDLFAELGRRVVADVYYLDACDVNPNRFGRHFLAKLDPSPAPPRIVSEHKADDRYPVVSAASIVAKVQRDQALGKIAERLEPKVGLPLGSGYAHDETTRAFLRRYLELHHELPPEVRTAWATTRELIAQQEQRTLSNF